MCWTVAGRASAPRGSSSPDCSCTRRNHCCCAAAAADVVVVAAVVVVASADDLRCSLLMSTSKHCSEEQQ